jgi:hypothetical protein
VIDKPAISRAGGVPTPMTPRDCVLGFIEAINRGDVEHLASLMADRHRLQVLDEAPLDGKSAAPHHAPKEWAERYKRKFDMGYEAYRESVLERQKSVGILPGDR